jgi:hypothetical protein
MSPKGVRIHRPSLSRYFSEASAERRWIGSKFREQSTHPAFWRSSRAKVSRQRRCSRFNRIPGRAAVRKRSPSSRDPTAPEWSSTASAKSPVRPWPWAQ